MDPPAGLHAIQHGHREIEDGNIGLEIECEPHSLLSVGGLADDCELLALEERFQPLSDDPS